MGSNTPGYNGPTQPAPYPYGSGGTTQYGGFPANPYAPPPPPNLPPRRKNRWLVLLIVGLILLVVLSISGFFWAISRPTATGGTSPTATASAPSPTTVVQPTTQSNQPVSTQITPTSITTPTVSGSCKGNKISIEVTCYLPGQQNSVAFTVPTNYVAVINSNEGNINGISWSHQQGNPGAVIALGAGSVSGWITDGAFVIVPSSNAQAEYCGTIQRIVTAVPHEDLSVKHPLDGANWSSC